MTTETVHQPFDLAICICTRNRPNDLATALESVRSSSIAARQVIVSDDSTDTRTRDLIRERFEYVEFLEGPRRGLCANRNTALRAVRCNYVLFIDDDAVLGERFIANVRATLDGLAPQQRARTIVTGLERQRGNLIYPSDQTFLGYQERAYRANEPMNTVVINATVFPTSLFVKAGFDTNLVYGCDEVDLTTRAIGCGYAIVLCADAVNDHFPSPVNRDYYQQRLNSSRLYVTFKRYAFTQRAYAKALCYAVIAPLHLTVSLTKRSGLRGLRAALPSIAEAVRYLVTYVRTRPDAGVLQPLQESVTS
jgi:glycosyltransferase involved in cell wall biosynthesis